MKDIQSERDSRGIEIKKVGIKGLQMPLTIRDRESQFQTTTGVWNAFVQLRKDARGTHMSRFAEVLFKWKDKPISLEVLDKHVKKEIRRALNAMKAHLEVSFEYFIRKKTPSSGLECLLPVGCRFTVSDYHDPVLEVKTPVTTLCPCSKEISKHGAHNQRSFVTIQTISRSWIWIEDIVSLAERSASCSIWPLLKRPDEKWVTEKAYENPRFVEDVVREVTVNLRKEAPTFEITWFKVTCENEESIHCHNAYAEYEEKVVLKLWQKVTKDKFQTKLG